MQLGPWCKKCPLVSFAVSTKSSQPFLKHISSAMGVTVPMPYKEKHACWKRTQMRHCEVLAALDANQSFLPCYPHLHGLWNAHLYAWLTASCICKFKISREMKNAYCIWSTSAPPMFLPPMLVKYASTFCSVNFNRDTTFDGATSCVHAWMTWCLWAHPSAKSNVSI